MNGCGTLRASANKSQSEVSEDPDRLSRQHNVEAVDFPGPQIGTWQLLVLRSY